MPKNDDKNKPEEPKYLPALATWQRDAILDKWKQKLESYADPSEPKGPGRPKAISSPSQLWALACEYFQECDLNPWIKTDFKGKDAIRCHIPTATPYTFGGFDEFLRSRRILAKLEDYRKNREEKYSEFSEVITRIENIIRDQKLQGALVGVYDARIVSAELGLMQKHEVTLAKQVFKIGGQEIEIG